MTEDQASRYIIHKIKRVNRARQGKGQGCGNFTVVLAAGLQAIQTMIRSIEKRIIVQHRWNEASKRLKSIPGIGIVAATAIAATVPDLKVFRSSRDFAARIGLLPRQDFDRRQAKARADLEAGRSLFASHSGGRSPCGIETRATAAAEVSPAHTAPRPQTVQDRGGGTSNKMTRIAWALLAIRLSLGKRTWLVSPSGMLRLDRGQ